MSKELIGDELLVAAFSTFPVDEVLNFKSTIVDVLYEMSKVTKFQELFMGCTFDLDGVSPYSPELEDAMWMLIASGVVGTQNINKHYLTGALPIRYRYIKSGFEEERARLVEEFSQEFKAKLLN